MVIGEFSRRTVILERYAMPASNSRLELDGTLLDESMGTTETAIPTGTRDNTVYTSTATPLALNCCDMLKI
jgi:hypothetical protein